MKPRDRSPPLPPAAEMDTPLVDALQQGLALLHASPPDPARAAAWFRAAADADDADGLAMLGLCLLEGLGVAADAEQARALLQRAATRGSAIGHFQLGRALIAGRGGATDEHAGLAAYVSAAALGHAEATFNLASCLHAGVGCIPDRLAAKALYLRSRALGCTLQPQGVRVKRRELRAVRALALRFADAQRLVYLLDERQQQLALLRAVVRPAQRRAPNAPQPRWRQAGRLAAGVVVAVAGTLGQYLRPASRDAGPTTLDF